MSLRIHTWNKILLVAWQPLHSPVSLTTLLTIPLLICDTYPDNNMFFSNRTVFLRNGNYITHKSICVTKKQRTKLYRNDRNTDLLCNKHVTYAGTNLRQVNRMVCGGGGASLNTTSAWGVCVAGLVSQDDVLLRLPDTTYPQLNLISYPNLLQHTELNLISYPKLLYYTIINKTIKSSYLFATNLVNFIFYISNIKCRYLSLNVYKLKNSDVRKCILVNSMYI